MSGQKIPGQEASFGPGIYVHYPFCHHRCGYCDFFTRVDPPSVRRAFLADLGREIDLAAAEGRFREARFRTIFLGGGTPSLLTGPQMGQLLRRLGDAFAFAVGDDPDGGLEVTAECNPESLTPARMDAYRRAGVNRISLGVQSMHEGELRLLDRIHGADTVRRRVRQLRQAGYASISLDLIYGLPEGTPERWAATLEEALSLEPDHLSAYLLTLEPKVPLLRRLSESGLALPAGEAAREQYEVLLERTAKAGLVQYEISNFARPGHESRHNQNYWVRGEYLGLGPSAHSHGGGRRWANAASQARYAEAVRAGRLPRETEERIGKADEAAEWIFLGLRRMEGVPWETLAGPCGAALPALEAQVGRLCGEGLLRREEGMLRLAPDAYFISDAVFSELMLALEGMPAGHDGRARGKRA